MNCYYAQCLDQVWLCSASSICASSFPYRIAAYGVVRGCFAYLRSRKRVVGLVGIDVLLNQCFLLWGEVSCLSLLNIYLFGIYLLMRKNHFCMFWCAGKPPNCPARRWMSIITLTLLTAIPVRHSEGNVMRVESFSNYLITYRLIFFTFNLKPSLIVWSLVNSPFCGCSSFTCNSILPWYTFDFCHANVPGSFLLSKIIFQALTCEHRATPAAIKGIDSPVYNHLLKYRANKGGRKARRKENHHNSYKQHNKGAHA